MSDETKVIITKQDAEIIKAYLKEKRVGLNVDGISVQSCLDELTHILYQEVNQ